MVMPLFSSTTVIVSVTLKALNVLYVDQESQSGEEQPLIVNQMKFV